MDYTAPPQIEQLIISIDEATFDKDNHQAMIKMSKAFQKSHAIQGYNGADITLIYNNNIDINIKACPPVRVPTTDIKRAINLIDNTVTLTISNISEKLAEKIRETMCLLIDTDTVKKVSNPSYISPNTPKQPYSNVNE
ncbi:MAG: hypothetical protein COB36_02285 [Alphaproteobacteria bacterium]|nr:MAG: hypothetical protein COB36_02285 [Alphaproteobacteria bacterium]